MHIADSLQVVPAIWTQLQQRVLIFLMTYQNKPKRKLDTFKILEIFREIFMNSLGILWEFYVEFFGNSLRYSLGVLCGIWKFYVEFFGSSLWKSLGILCRILWEFLRNWFICRDFGFCQDLINFEKSIFFKQYTFISLLNLKHISSVWAKFFNVWST